ncbi:MAG: hypothetical protein IJY82_06510 [Oscillospiraceae bacterium]|nr:hypothetical protein [Oscillospiraceae bacterium]
MITVLMIINAVASVFLVLFIVFCVYENFAGEDAAKKLLKKLRIPLSVKQVSVIGFMCLPIMLITEILIAEMMK